MKTIMGYLIATLIFVLMILFIPVSLEPTYIYEDLDGNIGFANSCSYSDKGLFAGGQGTTICKTETKTTQVKWYSYNESKEYKSLFFRLRGE